MTRDSATHSKALKQFFSLALVAGMTTFTALAMGVRLLLAQTAAGEAHFTFPDTPAAKQLQSWLAAFESGDRATIHDTLSDVRAGLQSARVHVNGHRRGDVRRRNAAARAERQPVAARHVLQ